MLKKERETVRKTTFLSARLECVVETRRKGKKNSTYVRIVCIEENIKTIFERSRRRSVFPEKNSYTEECVCAYICYYELINCYELVKHVKKKTSNVSRERVVMCASFRNDYHPYPTYIG